MTDKLSLFLAVGMLASFALIIGAASLFRRRKERQRAILMLVAALVLLANVLIIAL